MNCENHASNKCPNHFFYQVSLINRCWVRLRGDSPKKKSTMILASSTKTKNSFASISGCVELHLLCLFNCRKVDNACLQSDLCRIGIVSEPILFERIDQSCIPQTPAPKRALRLPNRTQSWSHHQLLPPMHVDVHRRWCIFSIVRLPSMSESNHVTKLEAHTVNIPKPCATKAAHIHNQSVECRSAIHFARL